MTTIDLTGYEGARLARQTAHAAARALKNEGYLAECEAWAQKWWGMPYEVVRRKKPEELEPQLTEWLNSLNLPKTRRTGRVELVEMG